MGTLVWLALLMACGGPADAPTPSDAPAETDEATAPAPPAEPPSPGSWTPPPLTALPQDAAVKRGHALTMDTARLLPDNVGGTMTCTNCHLDAGTRPKAAPWVGVTMRYPRYRDRSGKTDSLQDRINGCFERSMNGSALDESSDDMAALVAYMTWLSKDIPDGKALDDIGMPRLSAPPTPDPKNGEALFDVHCMACHQKNGEGVVSADKTETFPPLWGPNSYNDGAGLARQHTAEAFVRWNMPVGGEGTLTDQQAADIAAYFIYQDRPVFPGKADDWPKGNRPPDAR